MNRNLPLYSNMRPKSKSALPRAASAMVSWVISSVLNEFEPENPFPIADGFSHCILSTTIAESLKYRMG